MQGGAVVAARYQHKMNRLFFLEHPQRATSWKRLQEQLQEDPMDGTYFVDFHQCRYGLVSPRGEPMKKATRIWTNNKKLVQELTNKKCNCKAHHRRIEGNQDGYKLSVWSQCYPPLLCKALARCALARGASD